MSNIQVVVRCRGRNTREINAKSPIVVELADDMYSVNDPYVTINQNIDSINRLNSSKTYKVDQVYGSQADQNLIFGKVALPLFNDFMNGFNVTILAYGQTGTGKTHTMCGDYQNELSEESGIIPRVLNELFKALEDDSLNGDYMVKCSFIELYNEELKDLLSNEDRKLRIFENNVRSNNSNSILIKNLTEEYILTSKDGFEILKKGVTRRKTASTKLNDFSSRSHTIFSINLYRKQNDEIFKVSKMNLVDLAGSENITRSGAINQRAKEAGSINQSLLTLGRVINSLSDKNNNNNSHVPYRESKLTRLLQDSIGGDTKTTLIATISPAKVNIDETASTLDYASKAKNIKNLPQAGQDSELVLKKIIIKDLTSEIIRISNDLEATRNKNGIYLDEKNYKSMIEENEIIKINYNESKVRIKGLLSKIEHLEKAKNDIEKNQTSVKKNLTEYQTKAKNLERNQSQLYQQINEKDLKIQELERRLNKLNEKHIKATNHLTSTVSENLDSSIAAIDGVLTRFNESNDVIKLNRLQNSLSTNLASLRETIFKNIANVNKNLDVALDQVSCHFSDIESSTSKFVDNAYALEDNMKHNISDLKIASEKITGFIKEDHLNTQSIKKLIDQKVREEVQKELDAIYASMSSQMEKVLRNSKANYDSLLKNSVSSISNDVISSQRKEILFRQENWENESKKLYKTLEDDMERAQTTANMYKSDQREAIDQASIKVKSSVGTAMEVDLHRILDAVESEKTNLQRQLPEISQIVSGIDENNNYLKSSLLLVNKDLDEMKKFNIDPIQDSSMVRSPTKSSPTRSPSRSPTKSNGTSSKRSPSRSSTTIHSHMVSPAKLNGPNNVSRIPQLHRSLLDNKENISNPVKRRRILESINSIHNN